MKTSELTGPALDWMVATIEKAGICSGDRTGLRNTAGAWYSPSTDWGQGGPIIDRERMYMQPGPVWYAMLSDVNQPMLSRHSGPTPLIAAMRCFVASRLGDDVEIPKELL